MKTLKNKISWNSLLSWRVYTCLEKKAEQGSVKMEAVWGSVYGTVEMVKQMVLVSNTAATALPGHYHSWNIDYCMKYLQKKCQHYH